MRAATSKIARAGRRWLPLFALFAVACAKNRTASTSSSPIPQIQGDFWTIATDPDLGSLEGPASDGSIQQTVDFGIWQAADGTWQLWSCIRGTAEPGQHRLFYAWESPSLTAPNWTARGIAMRADTSVGEIAGGLQAPYVLKVGDVWHMFYGDWEHICHATSTDGKTFTRVLTDGKSPVFDETPPPSTPDGLDGPFAVNTRDPMVIYDNGIYRLYYSAEATYDPTTRAFEDGDYMRTSTDLMAWGPSKEVAFGGDAGVGVSSAECPFVTRAGSSYLLFRTQHYGANMETRVYRSSEPDAFGINDDSHLVEVMPLAAPEIVEEKGQLYVARVRADFQGIEMAHLTLGSAP